MSTSISCSNSSDKGDDSSSFLYVEWLHAVQDIVNEPIIIDEVPEPPAEVISPWLYLSSMYCIRQDSYSKIKELGITHVLSMNCMNPKRLEEYYWELRSIDVDMKYISTLDQENYNIIEQHWDECYEYLKEIYDSYHRHHVDDDDNNNNNAKGDEQERQEEHEQQPQKKVVVHCVAGINRSGLIVAAAMIYFEKMLLLDVVRRLKTLRGHILSNISFQKQLILFAAKHDLLGPKPENPIKLT